MYSESQYVSHNRQQISLTIHKDYYYDGVFNWLNEESQIFSPEGVRKWYKNHRNKLAEIQWPNLLPEQQQPVFLVIKSYGKKSLGDRIRTYFRPPRASRHWKNAVALLEKGINTPTPIFICEQSSPNRNDLLGVLPAAPHRLLRDVWKPINDGRSEYTEHGGRKFKQTEWAEICGRYVRALHDCGIVHRDLSGGNILIPDDWDGQSVDLEKKFILLDINRVRQVTPKSMSINLRIQDLERINMPDSCLPDYFRGYASGDANIAREESRFLKYRKSYRRIRAARNPAWKLVLKITTYWIRTG